MLLYNPDNILEIKDYMLRCQIFNVDFVNKEKIISTTYNLNVSTSKAEFIRYKKTEDLIVSDDVCVKNTFSYDRSPNMCFNHRISNILLDLITTSYDMINDERNVGPFYSRWFSQSRLNWLDKIFKYYHKYDWILVSPEIYEYLKEDKSFTNTLYGDYKGLVTKAGFIYSDGILIYIYVGDICSKDIYIGEIDSIRTKVCCDMITKEENDRDIISFEYLIYKGDKKIVKYSLK